MPGFASFPGMQPAWIVWLWPHYLSYPRLLLPPVCPYSASDPKLGHPGVKWIPTNQLRGRGHASVVRTNQRRSRGQRTWAQPIINLRSNQRFCGKKGCLVAYFEPIARYTCIEYQITNHKPIISTQPNFWKSKKINLKLVNAAHLVPYLL